MLKGKASSSRRRRAPERVSTLIHDISRITMDRVRQNCPELQRSCRLIMMELAYKDNITQLDLVHATHLKAPTISVSLQKMEREGLVSRCQDQEDLRATRVFLTEKGRALDRQIVSKIIEQDDETEKCLTEDEKKILMDLLRKIRSNLLEGD